MTAMAMQDRHATCSTTGKGISLWENGSRSARKGGVSLLAPTSKGISLWHNGNGSARKGSVYLRLERGGPASHLSLLLLPPCDRNSASSAFTAGREHNTQSALCTERQRKDHAIAPLAWVTVVPAVAVVTLQRLDRAGLAGLAGPPVLGDLRIVKGQ